MKISPKMSLKGTALIVGVSLLLSVGLISFGEAGDNAITPRLNAVQHILNSASRQLVNIDTGAVPTTPDETAQILVALDGIQEKADDIIATAESIREKISGTPPVTGAAEIRWTVNGFMGCPVSGNGVITVTATGIAVAESTTACGDYSLIIGDLPVGVYSYHIVLTNPVEFPGQEFWGPIVTGDVIAGATAVVSIDINCSSC